MRLAKVAGTHRTNTTEQNVFVLGDGSRVGGKTWRRGGGEKKGMVVEEVVMHGIHPAGDGQKVFCLFVWTQWVLSELWKLSSW